MGNEMDAALGAMDDAILIIPILFLLVWLGIGAIIMRNEEAENGR